FFYSHQNIARGNISYYLNARFSILFIRVTSERTLLNHDCRVRKPLFNLLNLQWREGNTFVRWSLAFTDKANLNGGHEIFVLIKDRRKVCSRVHDFKPSGLSK